MKNLFGIFIILALAGMLNSCGMKSIPEDKEDYIGTWTNTEMSLLITRGCRVEYKKQMGGASKSISGPIQQFKGNNFIVGALGINTEFVVSETPHEVDGVMKMTVDGVELEKQ